ncbi:MAG: hypothetical protein DRQ46_00550 [Gammaproteobacteria bacterium]|nr:MAG: hypothetical protein DRQ46_00550 [Gammaproteobacteria bacterium]
MNKLFGRNVNHYKTVWQQADPKSGRRERVRVLHQVATFLQFGLEAEEYDNSACSATVAIIMTDTGTLQFIDPRDIQFIDTEDICYQ